MNHPFKVTLIAVTCYLAWAQASGAQDTAYWVNSDGDAYMYTFNRPSVVYVMPQHTHMAQPTAVSGQVFYMTVSDSTGHSYYVPVHQPVASGHHSATTYAVGATSNAHVPGYHSHQNFMAPAVRDTRNLAGDVADLCLTLHPGAWLAEKAGLINRSRIVNRIRGPHFSH